MSVELVQAVSSTIIGDGRFGVILAPLLNIEVVRGAARRTIREWQKLSAPEHLFNTLREPGLRPAGFLKSLGSDVPAPTGKRSDYVRPGVMWEMVLEVLRYSAERAQAFGQSGLLRGLAAQTGEVRGPILVAAKRLGLEAVAWRSASTVSYGLRDWVYGDDRTNFSLTDFELLRCAFVLSSEIGQWKEPDSGAVDDIVAQWAHNLFETKLASYREFRPLDLALEWVLTKSGQTFQRVNYHSTFWREVGLGANVPLNARSGTTTLYQVGRTLVNTQSMTDAGASHKKKELMARAYSLRYTWKSGSAHRLDRRLVLLIDGQLSKADLGLLRDSGWSTILTPETIAELPNVV